MSINSRLDKEIVYHNEKECTAATDNIMENTYCMKYIYIKIRKIDKTMAILW